MSTVTRTKNHNSLRDRYRQTMDRIAEAATRSGRRPQDVFCVAVTKTASPDALGEFERLFLVCLLS